QVKTRVQARLSQEFQPVEGLVNTQLNLKQVDAGLQAPPLVMNGFSAAITFPAQYTSHRGIKIPVIDLKTRFDRLTVLDTWEAVSGETQTRLKLDRFIDPAQPPTTLPISDESHFQIESLQGRNPAVSLGGIDLTTALKADFHPKDIKNITLKGSLGLSRAEALNQVQTGPLKTDFTLHVRDMSLKRTQAEVALMIEKPLTPKPGLFPVGPL
ncbi:MAG: hypothetical protein GWM98_25535, partial [Nitrospinaceae bacterium]|nr:hypothetical protein [Nitrospinaceae bacterium]NIS87665.1 hypothetical protein [Nitrospinaceae bacterium]NIT84531.1 hypothetical protein [Nitrospinaceae bacterium]NIU98914.1 hypothetical protein [Nitrospinaceae bacterium]NIW08282.1 hypothetical protein [Nitrospinaceae bacterium]